VPRQGYEHGGAHPKESRYEPHRHHLRKLKQQTAQSAHPLSSPQAIRRNKKKKKKKKSLTVTLMHVWWQRATCSNWACRSRPDGGRPTILAALPERALQAEALSLRECWAWWRFRKQDATTPVVLMAWQSDEAMAGRRFAQRWLRSRRGRRVDRGIFPPERAMKAFEHLAPQHRAHLPAGRRHHRINVSNRSPSWHALCV